MDLEQAAAERARGRNLKWLAVHEALSARLRDGTLKPGDRPSIADLAPEFKVGERTAAKALALLQAEGFLERRKGIGYVVLERAGPEPG